MKVNSIQERESEIHFFLCMYIVLLSLPTFLVLKKADFFSALKRKENDATSGEVDDNKEEEE